MLKSFSLAYSTTAVKNFGDVSKTYLLWINIIRQNTIVTQNHLTPEIKLHLITPECDLWSANKTAFPFRDPFWAFSWPDGQALSRYILDNPCVVKNKVVLDFGCGSGVCAVAAALSGAKTIVANDIDEVACVASQLNAEINGVSIKIDSSNLVGQNHSWDCVLVGDMFYPYKVMKWLRELHQSEKLVLIGDSGRFAHLKSIAKVSLPSSLIAENNGFSSAEIWSL